MTELSHTETAVGIIIIGRNEGERLERAILSVQQSETRRLDPAILYVDSGSADGSVRLAESMGVAVHELDPAQPFSAGRARREGVDRLLGTHPGVDYIQFLDGDCSMAPDWLQTAVDYLEKHDDVAVACGRLREEYPERSIYNRMNAIRWNGAAVGDAEACGGIFLTRVSAYTAVGGFNPQLLTGEEAEICGRLRTAAFRIVRLAAFMASHDSDLLTFIDWWRREVWGGYGDGLQTRVLSHSVSPAHRRKLRSIFVWGMAVPSVVLIGTIMGFVVPWFFLAPALGLLGYLVLFLRVVRSRRRCRDSFHDAVLYSVLTIICKIPNGVGLVRYRANPRPGPTRPDPHAVEQSFSTDAT